MWGKIMNEPFEIDGYWWLPATPEIRIPGKLLFTPGDSPKLKLMGIIDKIQEERFQPPSFINPEIIHGISSIGKPITLYKCLQISANNNFGLPGGFTETKFIAHVAFLGCYFNNPADIQFSSLNVRLANLDSWYNKSCIKYLALETNDHQFLYDLPDPILIQINGYKVQINVYLQEKHSMNSVVVNARVNISISNSIDKKFTDYLGLVRLIQNFFTFAIEKSAFVIDMKGMVNEEITQNEGGMLNSTTIQIYYEPIGWQSNAEETFWANMLLPYSKVEQSLPELIKIWIEKEEKIKPVYDLFFANIYRPIYPENEFLNLTQAIETYHRGIYGGQYVKDKEYLEGLYQKLIEAIPQNIPAEFRSSLQNGKLRYANEFSLRKRLLLLCKHISEKIPVSFIRDNRTRSDFAEKIANTRNYLTHYSPELKDKAITAGAELFEINQQLELILKICLLEELEILPEKIMEVLRNNKKNREYIE